MAERPDLSPYLVHLTRDYSGAARENLISIINDRKIEARNPYGIAVAHLRGTGCVGADFTDSQRVACFSETPVDFLPHHIDPGKWRKYHFRPYGLSFSRDYMLGKGANWVWYINQFTGDGSFEW